ncbi:hypothetical protein ACTXT7_016269, partial [Hymenolepis weldensis]
IWISGRHIKNASLGKRSELAHILKIFSGTCVENCIEIAETVDVFRDPQTLLCLAQELANRKATTSNFRPSDGISTQQNAISLIERLYGRILGSGGT